MSILSPTSRRDALFLAALIALLVLFYHRSFSNPPRSDWWVALYYFHLADASPEPLAWLSLTRYDPWEHGTYRPVSHLLLYLEHQVFGVHFVWNHLVNFSMYCLSIVLLYLLALRFRADRFLAGAFLLVYAFLYTHFDIVTWTFQIFTTLSFSAFLLGFLLYLSFLETGRTSRLVATGALFLFAMYNFELYAFWPLALLLLAAGRRHLLPPGRTSTEKNPLLPTGIALAAVYLLYIAVFIWTRMAEDTSGDLPRLGPLLVLRGVGAVFFNLFYNGLLVNLAPSVSEPLVIRDNLDMAGTLVKWYGDLPTILPWAAGIGLLLLALAGSGLRRRKKTRTLLILSFLFFLYFTYYFIVSVSRLTTNDIWYPFTQYRYQYIANALLVLMAAAALSDLVRPKRLGKIAIACLLLPLLAINMRYSRKYMVRIEDDLKPLGRLLNSIRSGIEKGEISPRARLYIDDGITGYLPPICWNEDMARFMQGTYQWYFPSDWIDCFAFTRDGAAWVILPRDYLYIRAASLERPAPDAD